MKFTDIIINGLQVITKGNVSSTIKITNGKIFIDGKDHTPDSKNISIQINGDVEYINVDACDKITVTGNVSAIKTTSGDIDVIGNIANNIKTVSGDVKCGEVKGSIQTVSGDVKYKKSIEEIDNPTIEKMISYLNGLEQRIQNFKEDQEFTKEFVLYEIAFLRSIYTNFLKK